MKNNFNFCFFSIAVFLLFLSAACSDKQPKPEPGRCFSHSDCPEGYKCNDTRCEDIYFPRREIKPY